jgi:hypothetical protein
MNATFRSSADGSIVQMNELGQILANLVTLVPDGLVVFFPSYSFLNAVRAKWKETGVLDRLGLKKTVLQRSLCFAYTFFTRFRRSTLSPRTEEASRPYWQNTLTP